MLEDCFVLLCTTDRLRLLWSETEKERGREREKEIEGKERERERESIVDSLVLAQCA